MNETKNKRPHGGNIYGKRIVLDFSVNLNPVPCPKEVLNAVKEAFDKLQFYPDPLQEEARRCIGELEGLSQDETICGNGASELIFAVIKMLSPKRILLPTPSFYGYLHAAGQLTDCEIEEYPLKEENAFRLDEGILDRIERDKETLQMVILTNPNNPTGRLIEEELLLRIAELCEKNQVALLVDECFLRMGDSGRSIAGLVSKYNNLYVVNAFTKLFSIPGVRAGYLMSAPDNIERIRGFLPEWNLSIFAEAALCSGAKVLQETDYIEKTRNEIKKEREFFRTGLSKYGTVFESDTSFLLMKTSESISDILEENGILIRDCENFKGLGSGFYRIAVRTREDNRKMLSILEQNVR